MNYTHRLPGVHHPLVHPRIYAFLTEHLSETAVQQLHELVHSSLCWNDNLPSILITGVIAPYLDHRDVVQCRRVNRSWSKALHWLSYLCPDTILNVDRMFQDWNDYITFHVRFPTHPVPKYRDDQQRATEFTRRNAHHFHMAKHWTIRRTPLTLLTSFANVLSNNNRQRLTENITTLTLVVNSSQTFQDQLHLLCLMPNLKHLRVYNGNTCFFIGHNAPPLTLKSVWIVSEHHGYTAFDETRLIQHLGMLTVETELEEIICTTRVNNISRFHRFSKLRRVGWVDFTHGGQLTWTHVKDESDTVYCERAERAFIDARRWLAI
jgi:hypothetical protein